jgi:hypothetical protein
VIQATKNFSLLTERATLLKRNLLENARPSFEFIWQRGILPLALLYESSPFIVIIKTAAAPDSC